MSDPASTPRPELPTDAAALEPMGSAYDEALEAGLEELGLLESAAAAAPARASYEAHSRLLRDWNVAINLTAVRDPADAARRHVCDSLSAVSVLAARLHGEISLLDIGSGGGYPGLPLAAALPLAGVALLDSVMKKARFLAVAGDAVAAALIGAGVEPPVIAAVPERAEDLAEEPSQRAAFDLVTARAVGSLAEVMELGLPMAAVGGLVVAWKREDERGGLRAELREAGAIIRAAGGGRPEVVDVATPSLPGHRLVIVTKAQATPAAYPRPAGVRRRKRP